MLYHLFQYLEELNFPGAGMFQYITFRSACAIILSLIIATVIGKKSFACCAVSKSGKKSGIWVWQGKWKRKELRLWEG